MYTHLYSGLDSSATHEDIHIKTEKKTRGNSPLKKDLSWVSWRIFSDPPGPLEESLGGHLGGKPGASRVSSKGSSSIVVLYYL